MRPKVVDLTSFAVLSPLKLNHDALPFPLAELDVTTGDFAGGAEGKEMLDELAEGDGWFEIGNFKSDVGGPRVPEVIVS